MSESLDPLPVILVVLEVNATPSTSEVSFNLKLGAIKFLKDVSKRLSFVPKLRRPQAAARAGARTVIAARCTRSLDWPVAAAVSAGTGK